MASQGVKPEPEMRVVVIETQFVEIDVREFKSVVQQLTGKDAVMPKPLEPSTGDRMNVKLGDGGEGVEWGYDMLLPNVMLDGFEHWFAETSCGSVFE